MIPAIADGRDLVASNSAVFFVMQFGNLCAALLAGPLLHERSPALPFTVLAAFFLFSAGCLTLMRLETGFARCPHRQDLCGTNRSEPASSHRRLRASLYKRGACQRHGIELRLPGAKGYCRGFRLPRGRMVGGLTDRRGLSMPD